MVESNELSELESANLTAERWLRWKGFAQISQPRRGRIQDKFSRGSETTQDENETTGIDRLIEEVVLLQTEREDLIRAIEESGLSAQQESVETSFGFNRKQIKNGGISKLHSKSREQQAQERVTKMTTRVGKIDDRLERIFSRRGVYEAMKELLSEELVARHRQRELTFIDKYIKDQDLAILWTIREALQQRRRRTPTEDQEILERQRLQEEALARKEEILSNPEHNKRHRISELLRYQRQLDESHFAETPSRQENIREIQQLWAAGKRVLLTGPTGTGKTEMIRAAARNLYGVDPEYATGNQDFSSSNNLLGIMKLGDGKSFFEPGPLLRAMTEGNGQPILIDEIDRAPNEALMGLKTILNARPGQTGVTIPNNPGQKYDVGDGYAVSATANIRSEKSPTATDLDPAIVNLFEARSVDYIPNYEMYDLCLATLMDGRGGINLTKKEAETVLKKFCDAAAIIQCVYQGKPIPVDLSSEDNLLGASTDRPRTLKKAVLGPGRILAMLAEWPAEGVNGITFEEYLDGQILDFINNEAYPDSDRTELATIFALKGFLRGRANEIMARGLKQTTLEILSGLKDSESMRPRAPYLSWEQVARLDPYGKLGIPVSEEADDLLTDNIVIEEWRDNGDPMLEISKDMLGNDFFGPDEVRTLQARLKAIGVEVEFDIDDIPNIPYTEKDLQIAKANGEMLVLRPQAMVVRGKRVPITTSNLSEILKDVDPSQIGDKSLLYRRAENSGDPEWFERENFSTDVGEISLGWALVSKDVVPGSLDEPFDTQEQLLENYTREISVAGASNTEVRRRSVTEALYDEILFLFNTGKELHPNLYDWTLTACADQHYVCIGWGPEDQGLDINMAERRQHDERLGTCSSR